MNIKILLLSFLTFAFATNIISQETKEIKVPAFSQVKFEGAAHWVLIPSDNERVEIETNNAEIFNYVEIENNGNLLIIYTVDKSKDITKLFRYVTIRVYFKSINNIKLSGVGSVLMKESNSVPEVTATLRGTGSMTLAVDCDDFYSNMFGTGSMEVSGIAKKSLVRVEGVGGFHGSKLKTQDTDVTVSGVGSAMVNASRNLTATINGVGSIRYTGNPGNKNFNSNGLGSIREMNE